jgi:parallel beta-helix repeat protein
MAVHNSVVRYNQIGIDSYNSSLTVDYNTIHDNDYDGINLTAIGPGYPSSMDNNNITDNGGRGINGSAGATVTINSNSISFNQYGIYFVDSTPKTSQNDITNNSEDGIYFLRSGNGTSISNNTIANNSKDGIWASTSWVLIDNNTIDNNGLNGTHLIEYSGTLENNTVLNNSGSGVYLVDSSGSFLQYNNVTLNGINGIYSYNSSLAVRENNITYNSPSGVCPPHCGYSAISASFGSLIQIDHNRIENNSVRGIVLQYITEANVTDNAISDTGPGYYSWGIYAKECQVNISWNSMVRNGEHVGVKYDQQPQQLSRIENNTIFGGAVSGSGIILMDNGSSTIIANNSLIDVWRGMALSDSSARIFNNHIENVENIAIHLYDYGVQGQSSNEDIFNNTIINSYVGVHLSVPSGESASPYIHNNTITGSATTFEGIKMSGYGSVTPTIKYNIITDYTMVGAVGIYIFDNAHPQIVNNTIAGNYYGIRLMPGPNATIHGCNIYNNTYRGVYNHYNNPKIVNATENWWGHSSGPYHPTKNPFGSGNEVSNKVVFVPWLTIQAF